jgi:ABC-type branched-subunit amino acid transport system ATPase component
MLTVQDLSVTYAGAVPALRSVSLDVPERSILAVLGSNGAGKSTLLRAISGTLDAERGAVTSGTIELAGRPLLGLDPAKIARSGVVQVPEGRRVFAHLTVAENLRAGGLAAPDKGARERARAWVHELFPILAERAGQRAGLLSGGEQQMLSLARALARRPKLLLIDELSLGLAPLVVVRLLEAVTAAAHEDGVGVLLVEQHVKQALRVADDVLVMQRGSIVLRGPTAEVAGRVNELEAAYLSDRGNDEPA